jgi:hypothetical protein
VSRNQDLIDEVLKVKESDILPDIDKELKKGAVRAVLS